MIWSRTFTRQAAPEPDPDPTAVPDPAPVPDPAGMPSPGPAPDSARPWPPDRLLSGERPPHRVSRWVRGRQLRLRESWWSLPGWIQALAVYLVSRLIDVVIISRVARFQAPSVWTGSDPGYRGMISLWDGEWYRRIAEAGYPGYLPTDQYGHVAQNEWAFYPLYPYTARFTGQLLGTDWPVSASIVSLIAGALAVMVLRSLMEPVVGRSLAQWTVVMFCVFPAAPVLQLAYTESVSVFLLVCALWCLQRRWYPVAVPLVLLIGVVRPIAVPVAAVVALHALNRWRRHRQVPVSGREALSLGVLSMAAAFAAVEWPLIAATVTGQADAYSQTMGAWRASHQITPVLPWWTMSRFFFGDWSGPLLVASVAGLAIWWLTRPTARLVGADLRVWTAAYLGYLAVVLDPGTSLPRYLLLLFPFGTMLVAASPSPAYRRTLVLACLAGQILWVAWLWRFSPPTDWPP